MILYMKILILNPILFSGNKNKLPEVDSIKDTMIYNMCLGFKANGHDVTLLAIDDYKPQIDEVYDFEILYFKNNAKRILPASLPMSIKMMKYIKNHYINYDMILASEIFALHTLAAVIYSPNLTVVWQELTKHQKAMFSIPSKCWHKFILPCFFTKTKIVIPRSSDANSFISKYMSQVSLINVDHGINIEKFKPTFQKKRQFISIAQLIKRKNIDKIILKFYDFIQNPLYSDFKLLLAGRGDEEDTLRKLVKSKNLEQNVVFLGFLSHQELNNYVSQSYASLIDTINDLNMVSIPEAIASGTPVITNLVPALAQFVNEEKVGISKENWGIFDLEEIVSNDIYRLNCINVRAKLSSEYASNQIVKIFNHVCYS